MKSSEKQNVKSDLEEEDEEDQVPKKKGRLIKNSNAKKKQFSEDENEFKPIAKKRVQIDSDSDMMAEGDQENKNIPNAPQIAQMSTSGPAKGRRKVKKSHTYIKDGYMVTSDYSSYEEYDLPPASQIVKKDAVKKVVQHNLVQPATTNKSKVEPAKPGQKSQS